MLQLIPLYCVLWASIHLGAGTVAHYLPARIFLWLPVVSRSYDWERAGRVYRGLGIRRWKDRLPEAGDFYAGGLSKRQLAGDDVEYLERFALETSRAEFSHWLTWSLSLTFFAWNPWPIGVFMVIFGAVVNIPYILIQRYNRPRLQQALAMSARRAHRH